MDSGLSGDDLRFLEMLLSKEDGQSRIEIRHCRYHEYKNHLREREKLTPAPAGTGE